MTNLPPRGPEDPHGQAQPEAQGVADLCFLDQAEWHPDEVQQGAVLTPHVAVVITALHNEDPSLEDATRNMKENFRRAAAESGRARNTGNTRGAFLNAISMRQLNRLNHHFSSADDNMSTREIVHGFASEQYEAARLGRALLEGQMSVEELLDQFITRWVIPHPEQHLQAWASMLRIGHKVAALSPQGARLEYQVQMAAREIKRVDPRNRREWFAMTGIAPPPPARGRSRGEVARSAIVLNDRDGPLSRLVAGLRVAVVDPHKVDTWLEQVGDRSVDTAEKVQRLAQLAIDNGFKPDEITNILSHPQRTRIANRVAAKGRRNRGSK